MWLQRLSALAQMLSCKTVATRALYSSMPPRHVPMCPRAHAHTRTHAHTRAHAHVPTRPHAPVPPRQAFALQGLQPELNVVGEPDDVRQLRCSLPPVGQEAFIACPTTEQQKQVVAVFTAANPKASDLTELEMEMRGILVDATAQSAAARGRLECRPAAARQHLSRSVLSQITDLRVAGSHDATIRELNRARQARFGAGGMLFCRPAVPMKEAASSAFEDTPTKKPVKRRKRDAKTKGAGGVRVAGQRKKTTPEAGKTGRRMSSRAKTIQGRACRQGR